MYEIKAEKFRQDLVTRRTKLVGRVTHGNHSKTEKSKMIAEVKRLTLVLGHGR